MAGKRTLLFVGGVLLGMMPAVIPIIRQTSAQGQGQDKSATDAVQMFNTGRQIFRFDTFGDQDFWGNQLKLHQAVAGSVLGGVGSGLSPRNALALGLKVDIDMVPQDVVNGVRTGRISLDDPATTVALLKLNAVVGLTGFFTADRLTSLGIQCAL